MPLKLEIRWSEAINDWHYSLVVMSGDCEGETIESGCLSGDSMLAWAIERSGSIELNTDKPLPKPWMEKLESLMATHSSDD